MTAQLPKFVVPVHKVAHGPTRLSLAVLEVLQYETETHHALVTVLCTLEKAKRFLRQVC